MRVSVVTSFKGPKVCSRGRTALDIYVDADGGSSEGGPSTCPTTYPSKTASPNGLIEEVPPKNNVPQSVGLGKQISGLRDMGRLNGGSQKQSRHRQK